MIKDKMISMKKISFIASVLVFWFGASSMVFALGENAGDLSQVAQPVTIDASLNPPSIQRFSGQYGVGPQGAVAIENGAKVFGEQIFAGGFSGIRADSLNSEYKISPGDRVVFRIWGALNFEKVLSVDAKGNIFLPNIGPVQVEGVTHSQLDSKVVQAVKSIYPENVQVYTQLQGVQPIGVFVTGFVNKPGRYAGTPKDSILYYLHQASGIDRQRGSYRDVSVLRDGKVIAQFDLYEFILTGQFAPLQFQDGDTILIKQRGNSVSVRSLQTPVERFEMASGLMEGSKLLNYYPPHSGVSHVLIEGARDGYPFSDYLSLDKFRSYQLGRDDQITFIADEPSQSIVVQVEGSYLGKSYFILPKTATLKALLNNVAVQPELTDTQSISIRRVSVRKKQKEALLASLDRLENVYLTATSSTAEEATIRIKEAELIQGFVQRASSVEPNGRLVVATQDGVADVRLQDGDVVTIPSVAESVLISGQVLVPRTIVYQTGLTLQDYIDLSGGFTEQADDEKIVVIRQSGEVIANQSAEIKPGDQILVLPEVPTKNIQLATSITQILYQIAIAAKVAFDL